MTENNVVAVVPEPSPEFSNELELRRSEARNLELQVSQRESELRRAKEEQSLLKELRTMNEMILRKKESQQDGAVARGLKISPQSLAELLGLEDEIKLENRKTAELQDTSNVTARQLEEVLGALEDNTARLALVKYSTGWDVDVNTARSGSAALNEYQERKKAITALFEEQNTVREHSDRLTNEIELLSRTIEEQEGNAEQIAQAQENYAKQEAEYQSLLEQLKSHERIQKKKERMLNETKNVDEYKTIRQIEGDKKVLHNNISNLRETNVGNSKSILALEVRLRQLETKLEAVNLFLQKVFAEMNDEEPMEGVSEDATEVPLGYFEELADELELSRQTAAQRDNQLNGHDLAVEQLERKVIILQNAIVSRDISSQLLLHDNEKELETLMSHVDDMKREFDDEYQRLSRENAALRKKLKN